MCYNSVCWLCYRCVFRPTSGCAITLCVGSAIGVYLDHLWMCYSRVSWLCYRCVFRPTCGCAIAVCVGSAIGVYLGLPVDVL